MITQEQYNRLLPHRDYILSKRDANSFYGLEHQGVWRVLHAMWFELRNVSLDGNCFDCVQSAYNNFADFILMYEANVPAVSQVPAPGKTQPQSKRGRKSKSK